MLELLGRTPARHKIHLSHKIHIYLYICINEKISGGQWRTLHGEERGDKSTRPRWRRQLGRRLCRGGFLMMIDDIVLHSVQCKYGALMKISNEGNKQAQTYAASDLAYVLNILNVASHQHPLGASRDTSQRASV